MQNCLGLSEMEDTEGQSGLSCGQQEEVSVTFSQILLSFLDVLSLSATLWVSLRGHHPGRVAYIMDETQTVFSKGKLQSTSPFKSLACSEVGEWYSAEEVRFLLPGPQARVENRCMFNMPHGSGTTCSPRHSTNID